MQTLLFCIKADVPLLLTAITTLISHALVLWGSKVIKARWTLCVHKKDFLHHRRGISNYESGSLYAYYPLLSKERKRNPISLMETKSPREEKGKVSCFLPFRIPICISRRKIK